MKRFFALFGLTTAAFAASITVTLTSPTTITIQSDLEGQETPAFFNLTLIPGYYNNRAPLLQFQGPDVVTNDSSSVGYPGSLEVGGPLLDEANPGYADTVDNAINWISPDSTPGNTLYDTLVFDGPGPPPSTSFLFTSDNEVPTVGLQDESICYGQPLPGETAPPYVGLPTDCPIVPYGTVISAYYNLVSNINAWGPVTITFVDDAVQSGAPEPTAWMMMLIGIAGAALLRRRAASCDSSRNVRQPNQVIGD